MKTTMVYWDYIGITGIMETLNTVYSRRLTDETLGAEGLRASEFTEGLGAPVLLGATLKGLENYL